MAAPMEDTALQPTPLVCPTCGAPDQNGPECRRCHSDLRLLQQLVTQRAAELYALVRALAAGRWPEALRFAASMHRLRQDDTSFRLLAVCQLLNDQLAAACDTHRQYRAMTQQRC